MSAHVRHTCSQCGRRVYPAHAVPSNEWSDRADGSDTLGSGQICLAGPRLTHQVTDGGAS